MADWKDIAIADLEKENARLASTKAQTEAVQKLVDALERIEAGAAEHLRPGQKGYIDRRGIRGICRHTLDAHRESQP